MFHYKAGLSRTPHEAADAFSKEIGNWVTAAHAAAESEPITDIHDQGTYTTGWMTWLRHHKEHPAYAWLYEYEAAIRTHFEAAGSWRHGYWRMHEIYHGTQHFGCFLTQLWQLNPEAERVAEIFLDAAEHLGNWNDEVPAWFNWDTGCFNSIYLGTDGVKEADRFQLNVPDHLRLVNMAMAAFQMGGGVQYLNLASAHGGVWADAILADDRIPAAVSKNGAHHELTRHQGIAYREFLGQASSESDDFSCAENLLACDAIQIFIKLWQFTREKRFLSATERILDVLIYEIADPDASALVAAIRYYRNHTGKSLYDVAVLHAVEPLFPYFIESLDLDDTVRQATRPKGIGKRNDVPGWRENGQVRQHNPLLIGLAADISGNDRLAACAMDLARGYLVLARRAFADGREYSASARTVSAIARGHGRDNSAGVITEVWAPLQERFCQEPIVKKKQTRRPFPIGITR